MPIGVLFGVRAWVGSDLPLEKAPFGGYGLRGLTWVWLGLVWARYLAPSLPSAAALPGLHGACPPCLRRAWGRGVAGRNGGCGPICAQGPSWEQGASGSGLGGGGGLPGQHGYLGRQLGVTRGRLELLGWRPDRYRGLRQLPLLALRGGFPHVSWGEGGAGAGLPVAAVVPLGGAIGVRHRCYFGRRAWLQVRPSQYLAVHRSPSQCCVVPGGGGGLVVAAAPGCKGPWPFTRTGGEAGEPLGQQAAPQLPVRGRAQGSWASGVVGCCRVEPHKVDPPNAGDLLVPQEGVYPVTRLGRRERGAGHGQCPVEVGGGGPAPGFCRS